AEDGDHELVDLFRRELVLGGAEEGLLRLGPEEDGDLLAHELEREDLAVPSPATGEEGHGIAVEVDHLAEVGQAEAAAQERGGPLGRRDLGDAHARASMGARAVLRGLWTRPRRTK